MATKKPIRECYAKSVSYEWNRTVQDAYHKLEHDTTWRFLNKYLPKKGLILDAGGGPGRYTTELAKTGHDVILLDYTLANLEFAKKQIKKAKLQHKVKDIVEGSIVDLSRYKNNTFDAVICIGGPLSHVKGAANRQKAVSELIRVAKKGAPIFIAAFSKLGVFPLFKNFASEAAITKHFEQLWKTGEDYMWHGKYYAHYFMPEEFENLFPKNRVKILEKVGLEGFASSWYYEAKKFARNKVAWRNWLKMHYAMCTHPVVFATSVHFMIVSRKL